MACKKLAAIIADQPVAVSKADDSPAAPSVMPRVDELCTAP